jgi:hypothetical protein
MDYDGEESLVDEDISKIRTRAPYKKEKKGKKLDAQVSDIYFKLSGIRISFMVKNTVVCTM